MSTAGPNYAQTGASLANAGTSENANAWVNPSGVANDGAQATITAATFDSPDISEILVAYDFGFTIPAGSTIAGITVEISKRGYTSTNSGKDFRVQLSTSTAFSGLVGNNKASADVWPQTTRATSTYGGTSDTWGAGLTAAQVNSTSFSVFLSAYANVANADIDVDWVRVTITYTAPPNTNANAGVAEGTAAANADTANVEARGTGAGATTGTTYAAAAALAVRAGLADWTAAAFDATAESEASGIFFNAEVAEGTALAIIAHASLSAALGFAAGRSS